MDGWMDGDLGIYSPFFKSVGANPSMT